MSCMTSTDVLATIEVLEKNYVDHEQLDDFLRECKLEKARWENRGARWTVYVQYGRLGQFTPIVTYLDSVCVPLGSSSKKAQHTMCKT